MNPDIRTLLITYAFLFGVVGAGELLRRLLKQPAEFTRKCIHIGVGFWGYFAWSIASRWLVIIPPLSFVLINYLSGKWQLLPAMENGDRKNLGTVYYPLSICLLILVFWQDGLKIIAVLGSMVMALGDGFATIIGRLPGTHPYRTGKNRKTLEGSLAMWFFSAIACLVVLFPYSGFSAGSTALITAGVSLTAAAAEGVTPGGYDNLSVPLSAAGACYLLMRLI